MIDNRPIAIIGGYDSIAKSFYTKIKEINKKSIFINIQNKKSKNNRVYNFEIYQLKKIFNILKKNEINDLLFLGKINRPNLSNFKLDGVIDKYLPKLAHSYKKGDGNILSLCLDIFKENGFKILSPRDISESYFLIKYELTDKISIEDKYDINKSQNLLNDLSKYDNAQSIVIVNGYIIAIEAVEGTDSLLKRAAALRKKLNQIDNKSGLLIKIPKKNQSRLVDLPVVGPNTLKLIKMANLNGIAIDHKLTIVHNKKKFLQFAKNNDLKIYSI
jgi:DUF1009 family protein